MYEYQEPMEHGRADHGSASGTRLTPTATTRTKNSGPRDRNFELKLSEVGVFYSGNLLPRAGPIPKPVNFVQLRERALRRRPSLSPGRFTDADYETFEHILETSNTEADIMNNIIPIIEGTNQEGACSCVNKPFNNFRLLTARTVCGIPDMCYGSNSVDVNLEVQRDLRDLIIPSTGGRHASRSKFLSRGEKCILHARYGGLTSAPHGCTCRERPNHSAGLGARMSQN